MKNKKNIKKIDEKIDEMEEYFGNAYIVASCKLTN